MRASDPAPDRPASTPPRSADPEVSRRLHPRIPMDKSILICCQDRGGAQRRFRARAVDVSKSGVLVQSEEPVAIGTVVYLQTANFTILGKASVRHCTQKGLKYKIGLYVPDPLTRGF